MVVVVAADEDAGVALTMRSRLTEDGGVSEGEGVTEATATGGATVGVIEGTTRTVRTDGVLPCLVVNISISIISRRQSYESLS